jgi:flagellar hook-basal body complex protein FliE
MADMSIGGAASAYSNAAKLAERILRETSIGNNASAPTSVPANGPSFSELIGTGLKGAADAGYKSEAISTKALAGKADVTDVVTAVANAELALNTVVAVRDKMISAYQDIIRMPV